MIIAPEGKKQQLVLLKVALTLVKVPLIKLALRPVKEPLKISLTLVKEPLKVPLTLVKDPLKVALTPVKVPLKVALRPVKIPLKVALTLVKVNYLSYAVVVPEYYMVNSILSGLLH